MAAKFKDRAKKTMTFFQIKIFSVLIRAIPPCKLSSPGRVKCFWERCVANQRILFGETKQHAFKTHVDDK